MSDSALEVLFAAYWLERFPDIPFEREHTFLKDRKYRFDFAFLESKVAVEMQGKIWKKGRHNTGTGLLDGYEKYNLAVYNGWVVFQLAQEMLKESDLMSIHKDILILPPDKDWPEWEHDWLGIIKATIEKREA